jgi:hypothetical protein
MTNRPISQIALVLSLVLASSSALAQVAESEIVIEPANPDSNDLITLSVTNSACFTGSHVEQNLEASLITVTLMFFAEAREQCLEENPDAPDFERTIGSLEAGEYLISYREEQQGRPLGIRDQLNFAVVEADLASLSEGGINGLYYNPEADGHYLYVIETHFTTMVVWTTFDTEGNQVWVLGFGEFKDNRLLADTYINRASGYLENFELEDFEYEHWGTLDIHMTSCWEGTVSYESDLPEFGSGQFPIARLGFVKQVGC